MKMTAYGDLGSNGILNFGSPNVGSTHIGVGNVFTLRLVGHDIASRIASRQTLWIPTIETRGFFQTMSFTAMSLYLVEAASF
jgi:hypothetical protein